MVYVLVLNVEPWFGVLSILGPSRLDGVCLDSRVVMPLMA